MKPFILFLFFLCTFTFAPAQKNAPAKTDSVCRLVQQYFNEKNALKLYGLAGDAFKKALAEEAFKQISEQNLFPLGELKKTEFDTLSEGVSEYKAVFSTMNLSLFLSLDKEDKIETFLFKPYTNENEKKTEQPAFSNPLATAMDKAVNAAVQSYLSQKATAGLSIGILKDGKTIFYGYGETARGNKQVPNEHTIFEIGSVTKTFTAVLLADAVIKGKVKLNDPASNYLPDSIPMLTYQGIPVTLQSLSNHTSGIPRMPSNFHSADNGDPYKDYDEQDLFSFYRHFKPSRKPGEKYEYSNLAAATLGIIMEKVYHSNFETLLMHTICQPLQMNETRQFLLKEDSARFAKGYAADGKYTAPWNFKSLYAAGAIRSTSADMLKYAAANLGFAPAALKKAIQLTHEITFSEGNTKIGLGWHFIRPGKEEVVFHNGETGGYHSYLAINREKKFALIILSNCARGTEDTAATILQWLEAN